MADLLRGLIDMHTHAIDPDLPDLSSYAGTWPSVERVGSDRLVVRVGDRPYREVDDRCWSSAARMRDMDADDVAVQVVSPMPVTLCHGEPTEGAVVLARSQNDFVAALCAEAPDRLVGLGAVPLQDIDLAIAGLTRCVVDLGLAGVEIGTRVGNRELADPSFVPFFQAAADLGAVVLLHPVDTTLDPRLHTLGVTFGLGMPVETATAAAGLLVAGLLDQVPGLRLVLAHGGGALPQVLPRVAHGQRILSSAGATDALDAARGFWSDSLTYDAHSLALSIRRFGDEHVVLGTDYPFAAMESPAGRVLADVDDDVADRIGRTNALTLLSHSSMERTSR